MKFRCSRCRTESEVQELPAFLQLVPQKVKCPMCGQRLFDNPPGPALSKPRITKVGKEVALTRRLRYYTREVTRQVGI